jgi:uncharacterized protein (DUF2384 family)
MAQVKSQAGARGRIFKRKTFKAGPKSVAVTMTSHRDTRTGAIVVSNDQIKQPAVLARSRRQQIAGFDRLVGQLQKIVQESGNPTGFDARAWMVRWIDEPVPALGGARPAELMETQKGRNLVSKTLARIQSGAYA